MANFLIVKSFSTLSTKIKIYKRDFSNLSESELVEEVGQVDWENVLNGDNPNPTSMFDSFYNKVSSIIDKHIPIKQLTKRELKIQSKPWITPAIRESIRKKNKLYKRYLKTKSQQIYYNFKQYRNKINHLMRISKRNYYNAYFIEHSNDSKLIWKGIRQIIYMNKSNAHSIPTKINANGHEITDLKEIADAFSSYFANIGNHLASDIPSVTKSPLDFMAQSNRNSFCIFPTTASEIESEIAILNDKKAVRPNSIPIKVLKLLKGILSKPLEIIFNVSFSTGIVPDSIKIARVIPVFKKGNHSSLSNYRPISLLSIFNKLLEKLMYNRLINYLEKNNILFEKQFGFRAHHSTEHSILSIVNKIHQAIEEKSYSCGIFLDFSKAFDTVDHNILIRKLERYGIRGVANDWFISYLTNRKHYVSLNNTCSNLHNVTCGIPQGSVLGPLLFLIYINDFHNSSDLFDFYHFADDSNLFYRHKNIIDLQANVNDELNHINTWLCANKLSLNIEKSNFVIFRPYQRKLPIDINLNIRGKTLKQVEHVKYLGVFIDSNLSCKIHVDHLAKKIRESIGILSKMRYYTNSDILVRLYYALIYPFLIYALTTWENTYSTTLGPLVVLQKKSRPYYYIFST